MKNRSLYYGLIFCLAALPLSGQAPFILKGKLENCTEELLFIAIENRPGLAELDTIKIEADGSFFYENRAVTRPHQTSIQRGTVQFNDIYIAPGFQLTLTANVENYDSLISSRKINGIGAAINRYQFFLDSMALQDTTQWFRLATPDLLAYADDKFEDRERIRKRMLNIDHSDPYWDHFNAVAKLNNETFRAYYLFEHINFGNSYGQNLDDTVHEFLGDDFAVAFSDKKYLDSKIFMDGILLGAYLRYQMDRDYEEKPYLKEDLYYSFHKVLSLYQGEVRDCALVSLLISHIRGSRSLDALNDKLTDLEPFLGEIQDPNYLSDFKQQLERYRASLP